MAACGLPDSAVRGRKDFCEKLHNGTQNPGYATCLTQWYFKALKSYCWGSKTPIPVDADLTKPMATPAKPPAITLSDILNSNNTLGSEFQGLQADLSKIASSVTRLTEKDTTTPPPVTDPSPGPDYKLWGLLALGIVAAYFIAKKLKLL
jgi:hypothetical protein